MVEVAPSTSLRNVLKQLGRNCPGLIQRKCHRKAEDEDHKPQRGRGGEGAQPLHGQTAGRGHALVRVSLSGQMLLEEEDPASPLPTNATLRPTFLSCLPAGVGCLPGAATGMLRLEFPLWVSGVVPEASGAPLPPPHLPHQLFSLPPGASGDTTLHGFGNSKTKAHNHEGDSAKEGVGLP